MLPEVRMARVLDAIVSHRAGRLSCVEAGELLGLSERHFRRLRDAYEDHGEEGLVDRRRGRVSSARVPDAEAEWLAEMFRTRYFDFTAKHFHERVVRQPMADGKPFHRSYSCVEGGCNCGGSRRRLLGAGSTDASASSMPATGHDAVSRRLATRLAAPGTEARSDRDDGRCDQRDHFDFSM